MIRITRRTDYAIRILLALAKQPLGTRLPSGQVRKEMLVPPTLAPRIVAELARGGFIATFPGREGGVELARPAELINLLQVIEHFEGPVRPSECMDDDRACPLGRVCPVRCRWARLRDVIVAELESQTFDQLAAEAGAGLPLPVPAARRSPAELVAQEA